MLLSHPHSSTEDCFNRNKARNSHTLVFVAWNMYDGTTGELVLKLSTERFKISRTEMLTNLHTETKWRGQQAFK